MTVQGLVSQSAWFLSLTGYEMAEMVRTDASLQNPDFVDLNDLACSRVSGSWSYEDNCRICCISVVLSKEIRRYKGISYHSETK